MWSRHSRRIEPMSLSTYAFCQGDRNAIGRSRIPMARRRCTKTGPYEVSRSLMRYRGAWSSALSHLDDDQLDRLLAAVIGERKQRGRKLPDSDEPRRQKRTKEIAPPLAQGKLNAVRAAFKAGVRPSRREFGISHADVRRALASESSK